MDMYEVVLRILLAIAVGGGIGYERQYKNRPAGFRTHILVCVGAAIISMIQLFLVQDAVDLITQNPDLAGAIKVDSARMPAQVITGIGFLGAGTIMHERGSIKGLTTAATVWVVGCLGLAVGYGYYGVSIISGISVVLILVSLKNLESHILSRGNIIKIDMEYYDKTEVTDFLRAYFRNHNIKIKKIEYAVEDLEDLQDLQEAQDGEPILTSCEYTLLVPKHVRSSDVLYNMLKHEFVFKARIK